MELQSHTEASQASVLSKKEPAEAFNRILWGGIAGNVPYPAVRSRLDLRKNRAKLLKKREASRISHMAGSAAVAMVTSPSEGKAVAARILVLSAGSPCRPPIWAKIADHF
jgi:hypothetical protein